MKWHWILSFACIAPSAVICSTAIDMIRVATRPGFNASFTLGDIGTADGVCALALMGGLWILPAVSSFVAGVAWVRIRDGRKGGQS